MSIVSCITYCSFSCISARLALASFPNSPNAFLALAAAALIPFVWNASDSLGYASYASIILSCGHISLLF